jgi:hypothetical protein
LYLERHQTGFNRFCTEAGKAAILFADSKLTPYISRICFIVLCCGSQLLPLTGLLVHLTLEHKGRLA